VDTRITRRPRSNEAGVALLISLFALLLICVVGVALIMASGTESALTGNYRSATSVYYAALAGLEEGRGRMSPKSPYYLPLTLVPAQGTVPTIGPGGTAQVWYITNPSPNEPAGIGILGLYPDNEYKAEFPGIAEVISSAPAVVPPNSSQGTIYNPPYKWVRINAITAPSALWTGVTVNQANPGSPFTPLNYVNGSLSVDQPGPQALEITALAVMPNGSQRMLQYVVAPMSLNLNFPAALTLDGNNVNFAGGPSNQFVVNGNDSVPLVPLGTCQASAPPVAGIGYTNSAPSDQSLPNILNGITSVNPPPGGYPGNYTGAPQYNIGPAATPTNVGAVSLPPNWQTTAGLAALVQFIKADADKYVPPANTPTDQSVFPPWMSPASPAVVVVDGDLNVHNGSIGYGLLVVTGTLTFGPHDSWQGIVLVIGQGNLVANSPSNLAGEFDGAVLVANTTAGDPLGPATATLTSGSNSVKYSSCWINAVQLPLKYKTLSFREITPPTP
jgi:hypothetical protein